MKPSGGSSGAGFTFFKRSLSKELSIKAENSAESSEESINEMSPGILNKDTLAL